VAHDHHGDLAVDGLNLLERGQNEDSRLSQTGLGLADNVATEKRLRNTSLLDYRSIGG